jgi:hypothetical protein
MGLFIFRGLDTLVILRPLHDGQIKIAVSTLVTGALTILSRIVDNPDKAKILDKLIPEAGAIYIMDRGYLDFERLFALHQSRSFFVVRAKANTRVRRLYSRPVDKACRLRCDQIVVPVGFYSRKHYPEKLRRINFFDVDKDSRINLLTN